MFAKMRIILMCTTALLFLVNFVKIVRASENAYFFVGKADPACFVDEVMQTATLLVKYRHDDFKTKPLQIKLSFKGKIVKSESITSNEGRFAYASLETGGYRICIEADEGGKFPVTGSAKVYLQTQVIANSAEDEVSSKIPPVAKT